ncbi:MAG TPA: type I glyceraldehyde-3-phosphate dehydrogenase, partial [Desulfobulbaceae bacterium]|nr:type I glyceraldehyde-3-phosphate dehydrogenase [Desulfobulbaceae bacterium]
MTIRIGINGFGRIGRNMFRAIADDPLFADMEVVAINDLTDTKTLAHLLKYDSVMGTYRYDVSHDENNIIVNGRAIAVTSLKNPAEIPWGKFGADYVAESTGHFTSAETAQAHLDAGARKVVISAPAKGDLKTIVMGVNEDEYDDSR